MDVRLSTAYRKRIRKPKTTQAPEKRIRANMRERARVLQMNEMFQVLIDLLPPSGFRARLSRAQALREATLYIFRLMKYLESPEDVSAFEKFPHIFNGNRTSKRIPYRRPCKINDDGGVSAFISRHDLPNPSQNMVPVTASMPQISYSNLVPISTPMTTLYPVIPPTNLSISDYF